jgi:hypothetical protein
MALLAKRFSAGPMARNKPLKRSRSLIMRLVNCIDRNKPPANRTVTMIAFGMDEESRLLEDKFGARLFDRTKGAR